MHAASPSRWLSPPTIPAACVGLWPTTVFAVGGEGGRLSPGALSLWRRLLGCLSTQAPVRLLLQRCFRGRSSAPRASAMRRLVRGEHESLPTELAEPDDLRRWNQGIRRWRGACADRRLRLLSWCPLPSAQTPACADRTSWLCGGRCIVCARLNSWMINYFVSSTIHTRTAVVRHVATALGT